MKWVVCAAVVFTLASDARAQIAGGSVTGTAQDEQGGVLPGVVVTLTGPDRVVETVTDDRGTVRFLELAPGIYTLTAALEGFTTFVREDIEVRIGQTVDLPVPMRVAAFAETVSVTGGSPLIDTRVTGTSTNFTRAELENIPTSRDPWALLRTVPGVLVDRVNIGGNETGQTSNFQSKGTRPQDAVWVLDGIVITDMAAVGNPATYFNYDNFEEIQVSTAGQDIRQPTGGLGINLVIKRGTNDFTAVARGFFASDAFEADNVPDELRSMGVTADTADHNEQISDYGVEVGGPISRDKAWFYASYSHQDIRLVRRSGALVDRTLLKNPNLKINVQATRNDLVSFLFFNGDKVKSGRSPGVSGISFDAPTATWNQHNAYADNPLHGLWKLEDNHTFGSRVFLSSKFAYYNTGFGVEPVGGMDISSGRSLVLGQSFGSVSRGLNVRPQMSVVLDGSAFQNWMGLAHDIRAGFAWRRNDATAGTRWPGNGLLALENSPVDRRVRIFREGLGTNRIDVFSAYVGDTIQRDRLTVDIGLRVDHQGGAALPSQTQANPAFPTLVPGVVFAGYDAPFTWTNLSPRAGMTYALDESRRTVARLSISRYAGQIQTGLVGFLNPSFTVGFLEYRWDDRNGDHLASSDEVRLDQFIQAGGGFNPANPTAVTSPNRLDPDLDAPVTTSLVAGVDREVMPNLAVHASYSYTRTDRLLGNFSMVFVPRLGVDLDDYVPSAPVTGVLPDGLSYSIPTFAPSAEAIAAGGGAFVLTNWDGYYSDYNGLELAIVKRLSNAWMARVGVAWNNAREHYTSQESRRNNMGNPTRTDTEPLVDEGQFAPLSQGSGSGDIFMNAKWQINANGLVVLPYAIDFSVNVFGRQGYPFAPYRAVSRGADAMRVLVTPNIDTYRLPDVWSTDLRVARQWRVAKTTMQVIGDVFNLFNANTELVRNRNAEPERGDTSGRPGSQYRVISQNLSPRILRIGLRVGF
jgi:hypothetical protein